MVFKNLRAIREDNDLRQSDIAKILNISQNTYSQYENGQRQVPLEVLIILAKYYQTTLDYLQANPASVVIVSGGQGAYETVSEASAMALWLTKKGVDSSRIYLEDRSTDTQENLIFSSTIPLSRKSSQHTSKQHKKP